MKDPLLVGIREYPAGNFQSETVISKLFFVKGVPKLSERKGLFEVDKNLGFIL